MFVCLVCLWGFVDNANMLNTYLKHQSVSGLSNSWVKCTFHCLQSTKCCQTDGRQWSLSFFKSNAKIKYWKLELSSLSGRKHYTKYMVMFFCLCQMFEKKYHDNFISVYVFSASIHSLKKKHKHCFLPIIFLLYLDLYIILLYIYIYIILSFLQQK